MRDSHSSAKPDSTLSIGARMKMVPEEAKRPHRKVILVQVHHIIIRKRWLGGSMRTLNEPFKKPPSQWSQWKQNNEIYWTFHVFLVLKSWRKVFKPAVRYEPSHATASNHIEAQKDSVCVRRHDCNLLLPCSVFPRMYKSVKMRNENISWCWWCEVWPENRSETGHSVLFIWVTFSRQSF